MMRISLLQFDIAWKNPEENILRMEKMMDEAERSELFLLPEMCSTGFCMEPETCAEAENGPTVQWMMRMATDRMAAVAGSVMTRTERGFVNRLYFVRPDGSVTFYDKRHLFAYGGEDACFTSGSERVVAEYMGVRFLLSICYDLRFPVWLRNRNDYDVLLCVANWPQSRRLVWDTLLRARAIENQCYVAGVNRVGNDMFGEYDGDSEVINPYGLSAAFCKARQSCTTTVDLDMEKLRAFRTKFPVLDDEDEFTINL